MWFHEKVEVQVNFSGIWKIKRHEGTIGTCCSSMRENDAIIKENAKLHKNIHRP